MPATMKDIARLTGLGLATISKYINGGRVLEKNKIAIDNAIESLNYTPNVFARSLKTGYSKIIGVVIPELSQIFVTTILTKIQDTLRKNGYGLFVCDCRTDRKLEVETTKFLLNKHVDGLVSMPVCHDGEHLLPALEKNIPIILIDRMISKLDGKVDAVLVDNINGSTKAVNYLIENGHQKIGIITGPMDVFTAQERLEGWKQGLTRNGIEPDETIIAYSDYTVQGGYNAIRQLLEEHKDLTAVFASNYEMTLGVIIAIKELGISLPEQLSLIGFDNIELSQVVTPTLTIVTQPMEEIGNQAATLILDRLSSNKPSSPKTVILPTDLRIGESVKKIQ